MKRKITAAVAITLASMSGAAMAAGHYVPGVEGNDAATVPPPGIYYVGYLVNYSIGSVDGAPGRNTGEVTALVNRGVWMTHQTILGANYGVEAIAPIESTSLAFNGIGVANSARGVGDVYLGPVVLGWHGANWDAVFALGEWFDTGSYASTNPASVGNGYNSTMLTLGGTLHPDAAKLWSASVLARFEHNGTQKTTGLTPGNGLSVEWGIARAVGANQIGLVGYVQDQTSLTTGPGARSNEPRKNAIGLQFDLPLLDHGMFLKFAGYREYGASGGATSGDLVRMTIVKAF